MHIVKVGALFLLRPGRREVFHLQCRYSLRGDKPLLKKIGDSIVRMQYRAITGALTAGERKSY